MRHYVASLPILVDHCFYFMMNSWTCLLWSSDTKVCVRVTIENDLDIETSYFIILSVNHRNLFFPFYLVIEILLTLSEYNVIFKLLHGEYYIFLH